MRGKTVVHVPSAAVLPRRKYVSPETREAPREEYTKAFLESLTKAKLEEMVEKGGLSVEGTGAGGNILKSDLIEALLR